MLLWSKTKSDLYVDLYKIGLQTQNLPFGCKAYNVSLPQKSYEMSRRLLEEGNELLYKNDLEGAMVKFNGSLCFAEMESSQGDVYYSRGLVFARLGQYEKCWKDMELAVKFGYSPSLCLAVGAECLQLIGRRNHDPITVPKLSYTPDEQFPSMANVLRIVKDAQGKRKVVAREDLQVGQMILVERSYVNSLFQGFESQCNICLRANANFIPCTKCTRAVFCSPECQVNPIHAMECGVTLCDDKLRNRTLMKHFRILLTAINTFSTVNELMIFVDIHRQSDPTDLPAMLTDEQSKYQAFLKRKFGVNCKQNALNAWIIPLFDGLMQVPQVKSKFTTTKHKRFLMHLIEHHKFLSSGNTCCNEPGLDVPPDLRVEEQFKYINNVQVGLMSLYFTHSSTPNMLSVRGNGIQVGVVVRPIRKGDEILNSCFPLDLMILPLPTGADETEFLAECNVLFVKEKSVVNSKELMENCIEVLRKYGHIEWCLELGHTMNIFGAILRNALRA